MTLKVQDIDGVYGSMNDLQTGDQAPVGDRRTTTSTNALLRTIESIYTPDALRNKNQFRGFSFFRSRVSFLSEIVKTHISKD